MEEEAAAGGNMQPSDTAELLLNRPQPGSENGALSHSPADPPLL